MERVERRLLHEWEEPLQSVVLPVNRVAGVGIEPNDQQHYSQAI
jgi:hypothetical protein